VGEPTDIPVELCDAVCREYVENDANAFKCGVEPKGSVTVNETRTDPSQYPMLPGLTFTLSGIIPFFPSLAASLNPAPPSTLSLPPLLTNGDGGEEYISIPIDSVGQMNETDKYSLLTRSFNLSVLSQKPPSKLYFFLSVDNGTTWTKTGVEFDFAKDRPTQTSPIPIYGWVLIGISILALIAGAVLFLICVVR
jgi:hypothetical protein